MSDIRMLKNVILDVEFDGQVSQVVFAFGETHKTDKIERSEEEGYCNVFFSNGAIVRGISNDLFFNYGTPIIPVSNVSAGTLLEVASPVEELPTLLKGTQASVESTESGSTTKRPRRKS